MPEHPPHVEEASLTIRIDLRAEFAPEYDGDDDGRAWLERWRAVVQPKVVRAVFDALRTDPSFDVIPASRGKSPDENVDIDVRFRPERARLPIQGTKR
jgi:hypothetical protein